MPVTICARVPGATSDTQSSEKTLKTMSVSDFSVCVRPHAGFLLVPVMGPEALRAQNKADGGVAETCGTWGVEGARDLSWAGSHHLVTSSSSPPVPLGVQPCTVREASGHSGGWRFLCVVDAGCVGPLVLP